MIECATETGIEEMRTLALAALGDWDLAVTNLVPLKVRENAVFRVDLADGGRAVVRVHRRGYHTDEELESEFAWLRALAAAGIAVPRVIPSRRGRDFEVVATSAAGPRQIDLFEWIEGSQLGSVETGLNGHGAAVASQYHTIGAIAARIHNQAARRASDGTPGMRGDSSASNPCGGDSGNSRHYRQGRRASLSGRVKQLRMASRRTPLGRIATG